MGEKEILYPPQEPELNFHLFSTVNVPTTKQGFLWKDAQLAIYLISLKEKCDISVTAFNIDIDIIKIRADISLESFYYLQRFAK